FLHPPPQATRPCLRNERTLSPPKLTLSRRGSIFSPAPRAPGAVRQQVELQRLAFDLFAERLPFALLVADAQARLERFDLLLQLDLYRHTAGALQDRIAQPHVLRRGKVRVEVQRFPLARQVVELAPLHRLANYLFYEFFRKHLNAPTNQHSIFRKLESYFIRRTVMNKFLRASLPALYLCAFSAIAGAQSRSLDGTWQFVVDREGK